MSMEYGPRAYFQHEKAITELPFNLPGHIFRGKMPNSEKSLPQWENELKQNKITTIVLLITASESEKYLDLDLGKWYEMHNFNVEYLPIADFAVPDDQKLEDLLKNITTRAENGENVIVHCKGGIGRTGLVCSCLAKQIFHFKGDQAINWVRKIVQGAVETPEQARFINKFGEIKIERSSKEKSWETDFNTHLSENNIPYNPNLDIRLKFGNQQYALDANNVTFGKNEFLAMAYPFDRYEFWDLMLQNDCSMCVSIADGRRWDLKEIKVNGAIITRLSDDEEIDGVIRREFEIKKLDEKVEIVETKRFTQFDYPSWSKYNVPPLDSYAKFINCVKECHDRQYAGKGKIAVHGDTGVGRTGTFIASYQMAQDPTTEPLELVNDIRKQRPARKMVETADQYILLNHFRENCLGNK